MKANRPYFPGLDILRLFAALAVFIFHSQIHFWIKAGFRLTLGDHLGTLGVSFFFMLSGFLLTYLMYAEQKTSGRISISKFYLRRAARIWPLYYVVLIFAFFIYPWILFKLTGYHYVETASVWRYFLYFGNYDVAYHHYPVNPMLGVQWSLGVEEQFYIFLPLLFVIILRYRYAAVGFASAMIIFSLWFKIAVFSYYDTFAVLYNLAAGVLLANIAFNFPKIGRVMSTWWSAILACTALVIYFVFLQRHGIGYFRPLTIAGIEVVCFSFIMIFFVMNTAAGNTIQNNVLLRTISNAGKRYTYSIYLLHIPAIVFGQLLIHQVLHSDSYPLFLLTSILALMIMCYLAERLIEHPFMELKNRFY